MSDSGITGLVCIKVFYYPLSPVTTGSVTLAVFEVPRTLRGVLTLTSFSFLLYRLTFRFIRYSSWLWMKALLQAGEGRRKKQSVPHD
jgi:hypothetical protein